MPSVNKVASIRFKELDAMRGFLMILVVLGHAIGYLEPLENKLILSFHMAGFFFVSGALFTPPLLICRTAKGYHFAYNQ